MRILYFVNRYPAISHTFIRRELRALEERGIQVDRVALRADPPARLPDPVDRDEHSATRRLLETGKVRLAGAILAALLRRPLVAVRTLAFAWGLAGRSAIARIVMVAYWAEALLLVEAAAAAGADLIRVHFGTNCAVVARLARRMGGPPYCIAYHGPDEFDAPQRWDLAGTVAESAFVTAITTFCAGQLMRWSDPRDWGNIAIVRCIVDTETFQPEPLPDGGRSLCFVGRLAPQKGLPLLLDALALVPDPPHLAIVGDGPGRADLEAQVQRLGLGNRVRFLGALSGSGVRAAIAASQAFVLPSFAEGLPVVIMEAMAVGRPVIATNIAGIGELVMPGRTGWLVPSGSPQALADALMEFADADMRTLEAMGTMGAETVRARHTAASEAHRLIKLCINTLQEDRRRLSSKR